MEKSAAFEDACVQVLLGKEATLSAEQHRFVKDFTVNVASSMNAEDDRSEFAERTMRAKACHVLSLHRHGVLPIRLVMLLFLKVNKRFWGEVTVSKVVNA
ncbi:hypothetical protein PHMEG_00014918 [Phytophthora megakarya]|uniref:Uncharacterized protein n=1 Tax=Phytophthora megakarya TaxID=4795 RepID=A0A225W2K6_9STRA|nr:hypothetical protein PHMEG_00014918 [Phytophthora megakarya]